MRSLENDNWWMFSRNQFLDRKYKMQELYQNHVEGDDVSAVGHVSQSCDLIDHIIVCYHRNKTHSGQQLVMC